MQSRSLRSFAEETPDYNAYDDQKNYLLKNEICKPFGSVVSVDKAFHRVNLLCKTLEQFPPPSDRDSTVSAEDWDAFKCTHTQYKKKILFNLFEFRESKIINWEFSVIDSEHLGYDIIIVKYTKKKQSSFLIRATKQRYLGL